MIQSYCLISVVFKFLMKNSPIGGVDSLAKLYSWFFTLMDLRMPDVIHGFEVSLLIFCLGVENGEFLLYRNFVFRRNNSKDKSVSFLYVFRLLSQSIFLNSSKKYFLLNFRIFRVSFLLLFRESSVWLLIR